MKIGRNAPCPCGSGKKYKHCCGAIPTKRAEIPPAVAEALRRRGMEMLRLQNAKENVRQQQQGYGKPIISTIQNEHRIVAVGKAVYWGKGWIVFPDFLIYFLKISLGPEWGQRAQTEGIDHPVFRWLRKINALSQQQSDKAGRVNAWPTVGYLSNTFHLGYALYLIAHHDEIPNRLLRRLRDPERFKSAFYETLIGAALAVAGLEITNAEKRATSESTPEFRARSKLSGKIYEMEAKRKDGWTAPTSDVQNADFRRELGRWIRDQIYKASQKHLQNPVFWLELSIPTLTDDADWRSIVEFADGVVKDAELMTVKGRPIAPAFIALTNHTPLANEDTTGDPAFGVLLALRIPDCPLGRSPMPLDDALEGYDKYKDLFLIMRAMQIAKSVPATFDGTPPELLSPSGQPQRTIQIGDMLVVPNPEGEEVAVRVEEIASMGDKAIVAVHDAPSNKRWFASMPLSEGEIRAASRYTDAIFGKDNVSRKLDENDLFSFYDWCIKAYSRSTPEQVVKLLEGRPHLSHFASLPPEDAKRRMVREITKSMWINMRATKRAPEE